MKIKVLFSSLFLTIYIPLFNSHANAIGVGAYVTGTIGNTDWSYGENNVSSDLSKIGFGFIFDSSVANDRFFNYRMNIGYSKVKLNNKEIADIKGSEAHFYNSFGFGIIRNESFRMWFGPQIGCGGMYGEYDINTTDTNEFYTYYGSVGGVLGINMHFTETFSIGVDGGYRASFHIGRSKLGNMIDDVTGISKEFFANISFIFRYNDLYRESQIIN